jgi:hypothetical protein
VVKVIKGLRARKVTRDHLALRDPPALQVLKVLKVLKDRKESLERKGPQVQQVLKVEPEKMETPVLREKQAQQDL